MKPHETCQFKRVSRRAILRAPIVAIAVSLIAIGWSSYAFVSLQSGALPMFWSNSSVVFTINDGADPRIADGTDEAAVRLAFREWDDVSSSRIAFFEDTGASRSRTDWASDDVHLVIWDMAGTSGFFDSSSGGLVAITPVDFVPNTGEILDADILFNGKNYTFSTDLSGGTFDIQNVATHEVGHFIGLDHSAVVGATMNPFANTGDTRLRSLEQDDMAGASAIYPAGSQPGWIEGTLRLGTAPISGAHVVAEDLDGNPCSAGLSDANGVFRIRGLDQGQYVVYAEPLDGPVRDLNFSLQTSGLTINTTFGTTFWGTTNGRSDPGNPQRVSVSWGVATQVGTISALPKGMNITGLTSLQTFNPGQTNQVIGVLGTGMGSANRIDVPGPGAFVRNNPNFSATSASVSFDVLSSALPQLKTIKVWNDQTWDCAVLTGAIEIRLPRPLMEGVEPTSATPGTVVSVFGDGFQNGARAVIGGQAVNAIGSGGQVTFTVPSALSNGTYAVSVENPDGQFARIGGILTVSGSSTAPSGGGSGGAPSGGGGIQPVSPAASGGSAPPPSYPSASGGGGGGGGCAIALSTPSAPPIELAVLALVLLGVVRRRRAA